jgi:hypothetical protein
MGGDSWKTYFLQKFGFIPSDAEIKKLQEEHEEQQIRLGHGHGAAYPSSRGRTRTRNGGGWRRKVRHTRRRRHR